VIADVLLDKAVAVMAADHRIGQVHIFDLDRDLVRLSDGSIGVQ
jgi:hypothetical protein